jgi:protein-disulfide isomerase
VLETFPDKIKVVFKFYPLSRVYKYSEKATLTAYAAHLQGKFWPVHDELFKYHEQLNEEKIQEIVRAAGLNEEQLERDRNGPAAINYVKRDLNEAYHLGVNSVPTVFVNGKRLRDRSFESFATAIEKELKKKPAPK